MKTTVTLGLWLTLVWICRAEQTLAEYDWQKLADGGHLRGGIPVMMEGRAAVKISNTMVCRVGIAEDERDGRLRTQVIIQSSLRAVGAPAGFSGQQLTDKLNKVIPIRG